MDPLNTKTELFAFLITDENKDELAREFDSKDVMPAVNSKSPTTFESGCYAVIRLISADDMFVESLGNRFYSVWIATREQFDSKFSITGTHWLYKSRLSITLK